VTPRPPSPTLSPYTTLFRSAASWRRSTERTSRSASSGTARVSPRSRERALSPSGPSSASAVTRTLASTTSTLEPELLDGIREGHGPVRPAAGTVEDLVERGGVGILHEPGEQVLLQGLVRLRSASKQDRVGALGDVLDLDARHGAS